MGRRTAATILLASVVVAALAGLLAGRYIESPAESAARTAVPEPSAILAPVEERVLSTNVVARGTAGFGTPRELALPPSGFKDVGVVTSLPAPGQEVAEGQVLLTVSGRPVFVVQGGQPSYRDLGPSMAGEDVRQLEAALERVGLGPGVVDGRFDAATEVAVSRLYFLAGFEPVEATDAQLEAIRPAQAEFSVNARAAAGIQVPADEVIFVPATPVRVGELPIGLGHEVGSPLITASDSSLTVSGSLRLEDASLVEAGMPVFIDEPDLGIEAHGTISAVADTPGTAGEDQFHVHFQVAVDGEPAGVAGVSVRLTVPIKSTEGSVLVVPASALSLAADGSSRVQRADGNRLVDVVVEPGLSAGGFTEVTPVNGRLTAGDKVVIGTDGKAGGGG